MPPTANDRPLIGERIVVIGNTSSGKSTLAARLAEIVGGTHVELDALYWRIPCWQPPEAADFQAAVRDSIAGTPRWASSGNYLGSGAQEILWPLADTLIWLDMPLPMVLRRVVKRSWRRWRDDELLWGTQRENFWDHLKLWTDESLIHFAIRYHRPKRRQYAAEFTDPRWAHLRKYRLRSPSAVAAFLDRIEANPTLA
ncbi:MAG: adenylate kinase [Chloroflexi bacterium]|nr:adenylate kinase [Chloroflexota bacterium]MDA1145107.1 adenylate kinase [Chloroflexota bacterium]